MAYRKKMTKHRSKKVFRKTAHKTSRKNFCKPMRGGIRL